MRILKFVFLTLLLCGSTFGASIVGVTIESVSAEFLDYGWDLAAIHTIDGSGLSGSPAGHAVIAYPGGDSWQTNTTTSTGYIAFDLGALYTLDHVHVWNLNFYEPYNGRGAKDVAISTSLNGTDWTSAGTVVFPMATGLAGDLGFDVDASGWSAARYVAFDILSNYNGFDHAGHIGLSEVQFYAGKSKPSGTVPEPGTSALAAAGLVVALLARRRLQTR